MQFLGGFAIWLEAIAIIGWSPVGGHWIPVAVRKGCPL